MRETNINGHSSDSLAGIQGQRDPARFLLPVCHQVSLADSV